MYDAHKAQLKRGLKEINHAVTTMEEVLESKTEILNDATRLAVLEEQLQLAKKRLGTAMYDRSQTEGYGRPANFSPKDIVDLDTDIGHLERLVTSARFAVKNG